MVRKLAAVVIVAVAFVVAEFAHSQASVTTTKPVSAVDLSSAPRGWVPVAYGDAQVSVPATWDVLTNAWCGRTLPPIIQLGKVSQSISCPTAPPPPTVQNNSARFRSSPLPKWPPGRAGRYIRAPWTQECRINLLLRAVAEC